MVQADVRGGRSDNDRRKLVADRLAAVFEGYDRRLPVSSCAPTPGRDERLRQAVELLADDVGRLRRRLEPDSSLRHAADRLAARLEGMDTVLYPTAAELVAVTAPGDPVAIAEAIRIVDDHARAFRFRLGADLEVKRRRPVVGAGAFLRRVGGES